MPPRSVKKRPVIGRPATTTPEGYATVAQVAELLELSYSTVYRLRDKVKIVQTDSGAILLPLADIGAIRDALRPAAAGEKIAVWLRPDAAVVKHWEKAIAKMTPRGETPPTVSRWIQDLADRAAKRILAS